MQPTRANDEIRRRLKAARALTKPTPSELKFRNGNRHSVGITVEDLAYRINVEGFGYKTIGAVERGERDVTVEELAAIAEACGLPLAFFILTDRELTSQLDADEDQALRRWRQRNGMPSARKARGFRSR